VLGRFEFASLASKRARVVYAWGMPALEQNAG